MNYILTESQYFGTSNLIFTSFKAKHIKIEQCESFQKMSFRNRCVLAGGNGLVTLSVPLEKVSFDKTVLAMDLVYYNPNGFGVDLRTVDCDVYIDRTYLGKFQLDTLMHIPRRAEFVLPSRIQVDMKTVLKNSLNVLFSQEVLVNVKGSTRVGKAGIFATVPFNYEARHRLSFF